MQCAFPGRSPWVGVGASQTRYHFMTSRPFLECILVFKVLKQMSHIHSSLPLKQCLAPFPLHLLGHPLVSILLQVEGQLPWLTVGITTLSSSSWCWQGNSLFSEALGKGEKDGLYLKAFIFLSVPSSTSYRKSSATPLPL